MSILKALDNVGGIGGFISNSVVSTVYNGKGKIAVMKKDAKSSLTKKSRMFDSENDSKDENKTSKRFASMMGFASAEDCDKFFDEIEKEERKEKALKEKKGDTEEVTIDEFKNMISDVFSEVFSEYTDEKIAAMSAEEKGELIEELHHIPDAITTMSKSMQDMVKEANGLLSKLTKNEPTPQHTVTAATIAENIAQAEARTNVIDKLHGAPLIKPITAV